jgi:hypothetical protein
VIITLGGMGLTSNELATKADKILSDLAAKFNKPQTNAQLYKLVQPELDRAYKFRDGPSGSLAPNTLIVRVAALERVRNAAKVRYANLPNDQVPAATREEAREAALDILRWWAGVTGQALTASNARAQTVRDIWQGVKDAPKAVIGWGLEALGIPRWVLPVALVGAAGVVLVNLTGGIKAIKALAPHPHPRANPGRRRRHARRRRR